jgi:hypothetical protein
MLGTLNILMEYFKYFNGNILMVPILMERGEYYFFSSFLELAFFSLFIALRPAESRRDFFNYIETGCI